jgi:hypothetical protein
MSFREVPENMAGVRYVTEKEERQEDPFLPA